MSIRKVGRAFQPSAEGFEERVLTTAGLTGGVVHEAILPPRELLLERREALIEDRVALAEHRLEVLAARREALSERRGALLNRQGGADLNSDQFRALDDPPRIGPGLGKGLVRITIPNNHLDYGVVSIWNNTNDRITILVGASTHQNGQSQAFTIFPGRTQSYFAYSTISGDPPVFQVSLPNQSQPYTLTNVNVVFQQYGYFAQAKAGYPYAINVGVNGYYLSYI